uniref:Uncharacterized protein n=2 Tax=Anguilla anguilla TaxID=7936 RepID=A0A0E9U5D2_ANGAN
MTPKACSVSTKFACREAHSSTTIAKIQYSEQEYNYMKILRSKCFYKFSYPNMFGLTKH